jgi:hypothetical protein
MGDLPNPPACVRGAQLLGHQPALIRSPKATLFRCGRSILTEGKAHAATRGSNLLLVDSEQAVTRPTPNLPQIPVNTHGMPNLGLPGTPAEESDEGGGARAMANGADPAYGVFDVPEGPRGLERALASTVVDSEAAGPRTVESRRRANWPAQENATEPRPPSEKPTRTRGVEGEPLWEGINEKQREAGHALVSHVITSSYFRLAVSVLKSFLSSSSTTTIPSPLPSPSIHW